MSGHRRGALADDPTHLDPDSATQTAEHRRRAFDLIDRYLPEPFRQRLSTADRWWRGRTVLLLWALGYPLEIAWLYGSSVDGERAAELQGWMAQLDDARLIADLEASADRRGDGRHIEFVTLGPSAGPLVS